MPKGYKHGLKGTPEYAAWVNMRQRCNNSNGSDYHYYGGRGIRVCSRWSSVTLFVSDMGFRPSVSHQIDRIDNCGDYEPLNCRWVLHKPQMQNTRLAKWWYVFGVRYNSLSDAALAHDVSISRIKAWCDGRDDGGYSYPPRNNCWSERKYV